MQKKSQLIEVLGKNPRKLLEVLRTGGLSILDEEFDAKSPVNWLPAAIAADVFSYEVTLPPLKLLDVGNQSIQGLVAIVGIARMIDARTIFEIGTYNGVTALTLVLNLVNAQVHTLDLPPGGIPTLPLGVGDEYHIDTRSSRAYEQIPEAARVIQHFGDSAKFNFEPFYGSCDLVYVDGAHSFEYVKSDTEVARRLLSPGGAIVWDDYWKNVPGVPRFLNTQADTGIYRIPGTRLVVSLPSAVSNHGRGDSPDEQ